MKSFFAFLISAFLPILVLTQELSVDIKNKKQGVDGNYRINSLVATSDTDDNVYCLATNRKKKGLYMLTIYNSDFEELQKIENLKLGERGEEKVLRDCFVKGDWIYRSSLHNGFFALNRINYNNLNTYESCKITFGTERLLASKNVGEHYFVVTTTNKGKLNFYTINLSDFTHTMKVYEASKELYNKLGALAIQTIGEVQIDADKYYDLQGASGKIKSYFQNGYYVLSTQSEYSDNIRMINLETGEFNLKTIENLEERRSSVLLNQKYYIVEAHKEYMKLKVLDLVSQKMESKIIMNNEKPFHSTLVYKQALNNKHVSSKIGFDPFSTKELPKEEVVKETSRVLSEYRKIKNLNKSLGIIAEEVDENVVLTVGLSFYDFDGQVDLNLNGKISGSSNSKKYYKYVHGQIIPNYSKQMVFELWINPNDEVVDYQEGATLQSSYTQIYYSLLQVVFNDRYSRFKLFELKNEWYIAFYDSKEKKYLINKVSDDLHR